MRLLSFCALLVSLLATACGGRSSLLTSDRFAEGGAGGNDVGGQAPGGSDPGGGDPGGGGAGGERFCGLEITGPPIEVPGGSGFHQRQPTLAFSRQDGSRATLAMEWIAVEGPALLPSELRHASFEPWGAWPSEIAPSYLASFDGGVSFAIAPSPMDRFALLFADGGKPGPPQGTRYIPDMIPGSGDVPPGVQALEEGQRALALAPGPGRQLLVSGFTTQNGLHFGSAAVATLGMGMVDVQQTPLVACGTSPIHADALPTPQGWVLATTTSEGCLDDPKPATSLQLHRVAPDGSLESGPIIAPEPLVDRVHLVPAAGGPHVVWSAPPNGSGVSITAATVGALQTTQPLVSDAAPGDFAVAPFLEGFALGYVEIDGTLVVELFAATEESSTRLEIPAQGQPMTDRLSMLVPRESPDQLLLAWSELSAGGAEATRVVRLGCSP